MFDEIAGHFAPRKVGLDLINEDWTDLRIESLYGS